MSWPINEVVLLEKDKGDLLAFVDSKRQSPVMLELYSLSMPLTSARKSAAFTVNRRRPQCGYGYEDIIG